MAFLTLADETGTLSNVVIWPEQKKRYSQALKKGRFVVARLRRKESKDKSYGKWSYYLDDKVKTPVESAQRVLRRTK